MDMEQYISEGITLQRVDDMLNGAIEGGSGYWAKFGTLKASPAFIRNRDVHYYCLDHVYQGGSVPVYEDLPDSDTDEHLGDLTMDSIKKGIYLMHTKHPEHYADMLTENDDATTHDVFLQLAVMGEIIYG